MSTISLRAATMEDAALLLSWVNSPDTLAQKRLTTSPIPKAAHEDWLARRLADPATRMFIIEGDSETLGQVRLQADDGVAVIDIYVSPEARGAGVAQTAIRQACAKFGHEFADRVRAEVKVENLPSRRLFERLGFAQTASSSSFVTYESPLALQKPRP
jgi:RimJ/RimL family protein N-acetyltransferase